MLAYFSVWFFKTKFFWHSQLDIDETKKKFYFWRKKDTKLIGIIKVYGCFTISIQNLSIILLDNLQLNTHDYSLGYVMKIENSFQPSSFCWMWNGQLYYMRFLLSKLTENEKKTKIIGWHETFILKTHFGQSISHQFSIGQ